MSYASNRTKSQDVIPVVIGSSYNAYGIVRSFGEEGIRSILISDSRKNFVQYSKYLLRHVVMTDVNNDEAAFIRELVVLGKELAPKRGMLFPTHDEHIQAIVESGEALSKYFEIPFSGEEVCKKMLSKATVAQICKQIGIPTIKEKVVSEFTQATECADALNFPLIVKADSWDADTIAAFGDKIAIYFDRDEYLTAMGQFFALKPQGHLLVQEYIRDSEVLMPTVNCFSDHQGTMRCVYVAEKLRQYPVKTGTSTAYQVVNPKDSKYSDIIRYTKELLAETKFYGLSGTEFKYDPKESCYKLVEINIRSEFPNYMQTLAGQNMPYQIFKYHLGQDVSIPYYPRLKSASCAVPFDDWFYAVHLNRCQDRTSAMTTKEWKRTLTAPKTGYGLTIKDIKPFLFSYMVSILRGANSYIRIKHKIPKTVSTIDWFFKKRS